MCLTEVAETGKSFSFASSGIGSDGPVVVVIVEPLWSIRMVSANGAASGKS